MFMQLITMLRDRDEQLRDRVPDIADLMDLLYAWEQSQACGPKQSAAAAYAPIPITAVAPPAAAVAPPDAADAQVPLVNSRISGVAPSAARIGAVEQAQSRVQPVLEQTSARDTQLPQVRCLVTSRLVSLQLLHAS